MKAVVVALLLVAAAVYLVFGVLHNGEAPAYDTYAYFVPNLMHASRSLWNGGRGLLWNPFNAAGGPFFANGVVGLLYPLHALFFVLDANVAVHAVLLLSIVIGGLGALLLAREWGLGWPAAIGGALAFELGDPMTQFVGWNPMITGPLVWVPWAFLALERLLRRPDGRRVACLAAVLAVQLLPGNVLVNAFTYQVMAMRVLWEVLARGSARRSRIVVAAAAAMALAPLIVAVQLLPTVEFARMSYRGTIPVAERLALTQTSVAEYVKAIEGRRTMVPALLVPIALAAIAPLAPVRRRLGAFYVLVLVLYASLALGNVNPLFRLYVLLPPGGTVLHIAHRLLWVCGICLCLLSALGLHTIASPARDVRSRWTPALLLLGSAVLLAAIVPGGMRRAEAIALALVVIAGLVASAGFPRPAVWVAIAGLLLNLTTTSIRWPGSLVPNLDAYSAHLDALTALAREAAPQYRLTIQPSVAAEFRTDLMRRTSTVFGLQNFSDYEVLPENRYVNYLLMMGRGHPLRHYTDIVAGAVEWFGTDFRRRLLDVAAIRYVVASADAEAIARRAGLPMEPTSDPGLRVFRNDTALPRARWVPEIRVVPDPDALLARLANGPDDLATVALVEAPPPSGFLGGAAANASGDVRIVTDEPEHVALAVDAPSPGFVVLADHDYPGWTARVNGVPAPIERANYMFRLVEVPAGRWTVDFRFFPTHLVLGAGISIAALVVTAVLARRPS
jgi:hypothetical protein